MAVRGGLDELADTAEVLVIGAGIVGACCAYALSCRGIPVTVVDRGPVAGGTTGAGEGNLLISDKQPGPELELGRYSLRLWGGLPDRLSAELDRSVELELVAKGGLLVARSEPVATALEALVADHRAAGVTVEGADPARTAELEPALTKQLVSAAYYPDDLQVQPGLATAAILAAARRRGARVVVGADVTAIRRAGTALTVQTAAGRISAAAVVVAAGPWSTQVAGMIGARLPVQPRRGLVLVTAPMPPLINHKVYDASYLDAVASDDPGLQAAAVVESTPSGTVLIGSTRARSGFDRSIPVPALAVLARNAVRLFPALAGVPAIRAYGGFRPYTPDHLPIIGRDPDQPALWYATGHEGAGIGLAPATGELLADLYTGQNPQVDPAPFRPDRVGAVA